MNSADFTTAPGSGSPTAPGHAAAYGKTSWLFVSTWIS
jgi:hypothetical protein